MHDLVQLGRRAGRAHVGGLLMRREEMGDVRMPRWSCDPRPHSEVEL